MPHDPSPHVYGSREDDAAPQHDHALDEEAQLLHPRATLEPLDYEQDEEAPARRPRRRRRFRDCLAGPDPPRIQLIRPLFPSAQRGPSALLDRVAPGRSRKILLAAAYLAAWAVAFAAVLYAGHRALPAGDGGDGGDGGPESYVANLDCVDTLWRPKNQCGLDGADCAPFADPRPLAFRCPAHCAGVQVWNPHPVGAVDVVYRPFVIGGGGGDGVYRGDSFICGAAVHAGVVRDGRGGCGRLRRVGPRAGFAGAARAGLESVGFDSYFPLAFAVAADPGLRCAADPRAPLLGLSLLGSAVFSVFATSPPLHFAVLFAALFAHVGLVSDPPPPPAASSRGAGVLPDRVSTLAARFLPAAFCAAVLYRTCVAQTLRGGLRRTAPLEVAALWLGGFWLGALSNDTFDWIPIQRLTAHDLAQQPGAQVALAAIVAAVLLFVVPRQVYGFWVEGRLRSYLALYGAFAAAVLVGAAATPGLELRIHHYVLALLLLPGTSMQTRPSLLYQGLLLGLFVNGTARWGFDSVLQTAAALRGDGQFGSPVPVLATAPSIAWAGNGSSSSSIVLSWAAPPPPSFLGVDGISVLVNDVERYRGWWFDDTTTTTTTTAAAARNVSFTWVRPREAVGLPEYFRFAYVRDGVALDYSEAGTWFANGSWAYGGARGGPPARSA